jgi:hypothetical protein
VLALNHSSLKTVWLVPVALLGSVLNVQTPEAQHAAPLKDEPHYRLIFENSYARVFRATLPGRDATLLHQHDLPYIYVSLGTADFVDAVAGKPEVQVVMSDGQIAYSQGGFAHVVRTDAGAPLDGVIIELLKPQGEPQNTCGDIVAGPPAYHCASTALDKREARGNLPLFETDQTHVSLEWSANFTYLNITPSLGTLLVSLSGSALQRIEKGRAEETLSTGSVLWLVAESNTSFDNPSGKPWSYLSLSFEGTEPLHHEWKSK